MPSMPVESNVRTRTVTDPLALRALAHPLRLKLHVLVAREGSITAADAARQLGISQALASHHLRQLAKYGFVERADASDSRAHPWRVTSTSMAFEPIDPAARAPADLMHRYRLDEAAVELSDWQQRRETEDPRWADLAGVRSALLYLTPDELATALKAWDDIVTPLAARRPVGHAETRPDDAVPISLTLVTTPLARTEQGG